MNGGIDLNGQKMALTEKGEAARMLINQRLIDDFRKGDFTGITPVIINIAPMANVSALLGMN